MSLITITHSFGIDGTEVARHVAETLGWKLFDDDRLQGLIQGRGIAPEEVKKHDGKAPGFWALFFGNRPQVFLNILESVIYEVAQAGEGVIAGHGSQVLLRSFDCAFHVRLLSSEEQRAEKLSARQGVSREAALRLIRRRDQEQAGFFKFAFQLDRDDAALYDLTINTHKFDAAGAAGLIVSAARSEGMAACTLKAVETMGRLSLEKKIHAALIENRIDPSQIVIDLSEKSVTHVGGICFSAEDKQRIESIVCRVPGVTKVVSGVEVIRGGI